MRPFAQPYHWASHQATQCSVTMAKQSERLYLRIMIDLQNTQFHIFNISVIMKSGRGKENNQSNNNQFIASTYRVESDQKDIILKGLKNDHQNLKKNEQEYHKLHDVYKGLQHKYKQLSDQKSNDDREFKMRHQAAVRNIGQLKNQIDALRAQLRDKKLQISDMESDSSALKQELDQKNIQLQNFRNDYKGCIADSQQLCAQKQNLSNAASKLRGIIGQLQDEDRLLKQDNDSVSRRLQEMAKYQQQLLLQQKILRDKIQNYQNQNNQMDANISELCDHLSDLQLAVKKAQNDFTNLQQAVTEINLLNDKYKTECLHVQKCIQGEIIKNNNLIKNLKNAQYTQNVRLRQIEEGDRELAALKEEKEGLNQINSKLAEDLEACRAHLQNLGLINSKLVEHFQNFTSQDQQIRQLLNRKTRTEYCRGRVTQTQSSYSNIGVDKFSSETRISKSRRDYR